MLILLSLSSATYADGLDNNEYISRLNTNLGEMKLETDVKGGSLLKSMVYGVDDGYLKPEISKLEKVRDCLNGLVLNMENDVIENKNLQLKHDEFISSSKLVVKLLDENINTKKEVLGSNSNGFIKIGKLLKTDNKETKEVNNNIEKINSIYKEINEKF